MLLNMHAAQHGEDLDDPVQVFRGGYPSRESASRETWLTEPSAGTPSAIIPEFRSKG